LDTLRNAATLARHVISKQFDIVHSNSRIAYLTPILPLAIPKVMTYHRQITAHTTGGAAELSRGTLEFTAIGRWMIDAAPLRGRWHVVPNGVPIETYNFRNEVALDAPLVFLGRVEEVKGPHLAIEIARRSERRLVIAGNVPDAHREWFGIHVLPHIDDDRVRFIGPVDDSVKNTLLGTAAALLMPIQWEEPFGLVMAEAMACGTPVIGLGRGAVPEVVEHGVTGFVVGTLDEMVAAVAHVGELSRREARKRVERLYSSEAVTDRYISVYEELIERVKGANGASANELGRVR
jgi:glycosyltransferase involved in cell wall biosynthesis